jgi:hypothetical protein
MVPSRTPEGRVPHETAPSEGLVQHIIGLAGPLEGCVPYGVAPLEGRFNQPRAMPASGNRDKE